jgi:flagellar biosynthetic protein FlhB
MAEGGDKHSRSEKPTGKRISKAKQEGNVPRSRELASTVTLMAAITTLYATGTFIVTTLKGTSRDLLQSIGTFQATQTEVYHLMLKVFFAIGIILGPYLLIVFISGIAVNIVQEPLSFSASRIKFDLTRLNPATGFGRLFNKDSVVEALKSLVKIFIVGYIAFKVLRDELDAIVYLTESDIGGLFDFIAHIAFKIVLHTCGVLFILAIFDLFYVKWRFLDNLKMTKQEVKQEMKDAEGDPRIKGKIKSMQLAQARRRMRKIIPTADVVITNPTHYAVALKYDREAMAAPRVIFKGVDHLAQQIKAVAKENRIMLVENRFLARELYAQVEENQEIPETLYAAVAEVLAYVYSLKGKI